MTGIQCGAAGALMFPAAAGGITIVDQGTVEESATITFNISLLENDVAVAVTASQDADGTEMAISGWTQIAATPNNRPGAWIGYKRMGATPDTTATIGDARVGCCWFVLRGVDTSNALDDTPATANSNSGAVDPPANTVNNIGAFQLVTGSMDGATLTSFTAPSGFTTEDFANQSSGDASAFWGWKIATATGSDDPGTFTQSATNRWRAFHVPFRAA